MQGEGDAELTIAAAVSIGREGRRGHDQEDSEQRCAGKQVEVALLVALFEILMSQKKRLGIGSTGGSTMLSASKKLKPQSGLESFEKHVVQQVTSEEDGTSDLMTIDLKADELSGPTSGMVMGGGITANLSRKKATPPQPARKLVIKPFKGLS